MQPVSFTVLSEFHPYDTQYTTTYTVHVYRQDYRWQLSSLTFIGLVAPLHPPDVPQTAEPDSTKEYIVNQLNVPFKSNVVNYEMLVSYETSALAISGHSQSQVAPTCTVPKTNLAVHQWT